MSHLEVQGDDGEFLLAPPESIGGPLGFHRDLFAPKWSDGIHKQIFVQIRKIRIKKHSTFTNV